MRDDRVSIDTSPWPHVVSLDERPFRLLPPLPTERELAQMGAGDYLLLKETLTRKARYLEKAHKLAHLGHWEYVVAEGCMYWSDEIFEIVGLGSLKRPPSAAERAALHTPESWMRLNDALERVVRSGEAFQEDVELIRPDGERRWLTIMGETERDDEGRVAKVIGVAQDITERKAIEAALRASEARLQEAQSLCRVGDWELDRDSGRMSWSREVFSLFDRPEPLGVPDLNEAMCYYPPESLEHTRTAFWQAIDTAERVTLEQEVHLPSGQVRYHATLIVPVVDASNRVIKLIGTVQDITERKRLEVERGAHVERLAELSRRLVQIQEHERRKLAGDLHDRASPNLAALQLTLSTLAGALPAEILAEVEPLLDDAHALLADTTTGIREISTQLRPATLDYAGLVAALQDYADQFQRRSGITATVDTSHFDATLPADLQSILFRIVQEALTNCAKHASARTISITLASDMRELRLRIADDGVGFDPAQLGDPSAAAGLGLITMRERAEFAGGRFCIRSILGGGTEVRVTFDLPGEPV